MENNETLLGGVLDVTEDSLKESYMEKIQSGQESLLGTASEFGDTDYNDTTSFIDSEHQKIEDVIEERKKFFLNPENQAEILLQNYLMSNPGLYLTGKQKRNLKREFLKNAKKGKYKKIFTEQAERLPDNAFKNLNE